MLYDCDATGLSIYKDHLTDIAAKVFNPPVPLPACAFSSLVRTSRTISTPGIVSRITGITSNLLRGEKPLSIVLPKFIECATYKEEAVEGHVPTKVSRICLYFLEHDGEILCEVNGNKQRSPLAQGGLEIPCKLTFIGKPKLIKKLKKLLK